MRATTKNKGSNPTGGQRHTPTVNKKGDGKNVIQLIRLIISMHYATCSLSQSDLKDMFYFIKAIGIFSDSTTGIQHAGGLLSQHLLVIGASVGVFPLMFSFYGEIDDTKSRAGLQKRFPVFKDGEDACVESANILKALSFYLGKSCMYCENLTCEEVRTRVTGRVLRWVDSYYPFQKGLYDVKMLESHQPKLVLVSSTTISNVELPTYQSTKPSDNLSLECYDESGELWHRRTNNMIKKKQQSRSSFGSRMKFKPFDNICVLLCSN